MITITGSGFTTSTTVWIGQGHGAGAAHGAIPATIVTVTPTEITATTGGGAVAGRWGVFVTTNGITNAFTPAARFRYQ